MKTVGVCLAIAMMVALPMEAAIACTVQGSELAAKARKKRLVGAIRVEGQYRIERTDPGGNGLDELRKIWGTITAKNGKQYRTIHVEDGRVIVLCAVFYTPSQDVEGVFYIRRQKDKSFQLIHWEDKYLLEPTESEIEGK